MSFHPEKMKRAASEGFHPERMRQAATEEAPVKFQPQRMEHAASEVPPRKFQPEKMKHAASEDIQKGGRFRRLGGRAARYLREARHEPKEAYLSYRVARKLLNRDNRGRFKAGLKRGAQLTAQGLREANKARLSAERSIYGPSGSGPRRRMGARPHQTIIGFKSCPNCKAKFDKLRARCSSCGFPFTTGTRGRKERHLK